MGNMILWSGLVVMGSILDIVTTYKGMKGYSPEEMGQRELNPFVKSVIGRKWVAVSLKIVSIMPLLACSYYLDTVVILQVMSLLLFFVVVQNMYAYWAERHGHLSLGLLLVRRWHLSGGIAFWLLVCLMLTISIAIVFAFNSEEFTYLLTTR